MIGLFVPLSGLCVPELGDKSVSDFSFYLERLAYLFRIGRFRLVYLFYDWLVFFTDWHMCSTDWPFVRLTGLCVPEPGDEAVPGGAHIGCLASIGALGLFVPYRTAPTGLIISVCTDWLIHSMTGLFIPLTGLCVPEPGDEAVP